VLRNLRSMHVIVYRRWKCCKACGTDYACFYTGCKEKD